MLDLRKAHKFLYILLLLLLPFTGMQWGECNHSISYNEHELEKKHQVRKSVTVVIDVFRAFTTAGYILEKKPLLYMLATKSSVISRLAANLENPLLIGKPEKDAYLMYNIPNSPTRVLEKDVVGRHVLHRSAAGAQGILQARDGGIVLATGFVNASATARYIQSLENPKITFVPMGHEGVSPSLEDELCSLYVQNLIAGKKLDLLPYLDALREGPGRYFFSEDQWQYPAEDFARCLEIDRFNFIIRAEVWGEYAILTRWDQTP